MTAPRLEVERITVRFDGVEALRDVSLVVEPGALVALIGPNGAGKTTLLDVVSGRRRPARGRLRLDGVDVTGLAPHRIAARGVGRTFQIACLFPGLPAIENVLVGVTFGPAPPATASQRRQRAAELLEWVGLADRAAVPAARLSLGEQKRLELAVALGPAPRLLLLDELAGGLPPHGRDEVYQACAGLRRRGLGVLAIEHGLARLAALADRVVVLDQGRVVAAGPPAEVLAAPEVVNAHLGEDDA
jgi:branched-chain amino acid transport system ATP-binding protein